MNIIGKSAFSYTLIESICIPSHVSHIKKYAFSYCKNLKTVEFSMNSELDSIDDYAFSNTLIESISIPQSVSFIGQYVFYSEKSTLKTVEFIENSNLKFQTKHLQILQLKVLQFQKNLLESEMESFVIHLIL